MEPVDKSHYSKHQDSDDSPALIGHKTVTVNILLAGTNISKVIKNTETQTILSPLNINILKDTQPNIRNLQDIYFLFVRKFKRMGNVTGNVGTI